MCEKAIDTTRRYHEFAYTARGEGDAAVTPMLTENLYSADRSRAIFDALKRPFVSLDGRITPGADPGECLGEEFTL